MELPDAQPLSSLGQLEKDRVHLFVAGPGTGEGVAVHLPDEGWLLLDSATVYVQGSRQSPTVSIVEACSDGLDCNEVRWFIVTHPHTDHFGGADRILLHANEAFKPSRVGTTFLRTAADWRVFRDLENLQKRLGGLRTALKAWSEDTGLHVQPVQDGVPLDGLVSQRSGLCVTVHHPPNHIVPCLAGADDPATELAKLSGYERNQLSAVVSIRFGQTHILLPGDLECHKGDGESAVGWAPLLERTPDLADHHALKIPHHGSPGALDPRLLVPSPEGGERAWVLAPFSGHRLPPASAVATLLSHEEQLHVTTSPKHFADDEVVKLVHIELPAAGSGHTVPPARRATAPVTDPLSPIWAFAFDSAGQCTGRWCGPSAALLSRRAPTPVTA